VHPEKRIPFLDALFKEIHMSKRIFISAAALLALLLVYAPAWAQDNPNPIFTYVDEWAVPRAQWGEMAKFNAGSKVILDRLVADGTVVGYGSYENRVHSEGGYTHGGYFQATSLANLFKALELLYSDPSVTSPALAASKHQDLLMLSTHYGSRPVTNSTGYLRVISAQIQPGKMGDFLEVYRRYLLPLYDKLLADGAIVAHQLDSEYNIENAPGRVFAVVIARDADGLDKVRTAFGNLFAQNPAIGNALDSASVPNSRNDLLARITEMTHK
jgi:hypothetical protein